ncbi:TonB-dependent receptor plug domain-containing protein, partial [Elusimicrobiota bacterium]
ILLTLLFIFTGSIDLSATSEKNELDMFFTDIPIVVTAAKKAEGIYDAPGVITVISRREVEAFAADNLGEILDRLPGSQYLPTNCFRKNTVYIRGQALTPYNNHVLILMNGRPVRDPTTGGLNLAIYNTFPVDIIDHIEVIRGPGSVLYGSCAYSGIINIITKTPEDEGVTGSVAASVASNNRLDETITFGFKQNALSGYLAVNKIDSDGMEIKMYDGLHNYGEGRFSDDITAAVANINYADLKASVLYAKTQPYHLGGANLNWVYQYTDKEQDPTDCNSQHVLTTDVGYSKKLSDQVTTDLNITYNYRKWDIEDDEANNGHDFLVEIANHIAPSDKLGLICGGTYEKTEYGGHKLIDNDELFGYSLYTQSDYKVSDPVKLILGVQWNKIKDLDGDLSKRAGIIYNSENKYGAKVLYSEAFRKAYAHETSFQHPVFRGNLDVTPELIATTDLQLFYNTDKTETALTFFYSILSNMIKRRWEVDPANFPYGGYLIHYNSDIDHTFQGVELEERFKVSEKILLTGSATYQTNEDEDGNKNIALHPNILAKIGLIYTEDMFRVGVYNGYFGEPTPVNEFNTPETAVPELNPDAEAYNMLTVKAELDVYKIFGSGEGDTLMLGLEGNNLLDLDPRYPEFTSRGINTLMPLSVGATYKAELKYKF